MTSVRSVPLGQIRYVKATLDRTLFAVRERVYIGPIAQKCGMPPLPGVPTLLLFITSYPFGAIVPTQPFAISVVYVKFSKRRSGKSWEKG
jgi:hypothetical protein